MELDNGHVYPDKKYIESLLYSSLITLIPGLYAIYRNYYDFGIIHIAIVSTSINYWKYPKIISWERYLDICTVSFGICYTLYYSIITINKIIYLIFLTVGIRLYMLSQYFSSIENYDLSVECHMRMHIIINMGYMILYNGVLY